MGVLQRFEQRLDTLVNGAFAKAFRSEVQPVEIAGALQRELDDKAVPLGTDRTVGPNTFTVELSPRDHDRLGPYAVAAGRRAGGDGPRARRVGERRAARPGRGRRCSAPTTSAPACSGSAAPRPRASPPSRSAARCTSRRPPSPAAPGADAGHVQPRPLAADPADRRRCPRRPRPAPDRPRSGRRGRPPAPADPAPVDLGARPAAGPPAPGRPRHRVPADQADRLDRPRRRRRHPHRRPGRLPPPRELPRRRPRARVVDLASTNGTWIADQRISEAPLSDGDEIRVGSTTLVFRAG